MRRARAAERGFTLLEVMIALAILFMALVMLLRATAGNIYTADRSYMTGVATELARAKMYDLEEELRKEGFSDVDEEESGDFVDEGWPDIRWEAEIIRPELPDLAGMAQAMREDEPVPDEVDDLDVPGAGGLDDAADELMGDDMLGFGGGGMAGGLISMVPPAALGMLQGVFEQAIRKIELTVTYDTIQGEESMLVELYVTEPKHVTQAMGGLGALGGGAGDVDDLDDLDGGGDGAEPGDDDGAAGDRGGGIPGGGRDSRPRR